MCRSTAGAGHVVSLIVPTSEDRVVDGVAIKAVPRVSTRLGRMLWTTWSVYRRAINENADIYHLHDPELLPVGLVLRRFRKCEVICDFHENVPEQILTKHYIPRMLRKWIAAAYGLFERYSVNRLSAIVTANEDINRHFAYCRNPVVAVHNYADDAEFRSTVETDDSRYEAGLVFHCNASDRTSFPAVLRAFTDLPSDLASKLVITRASFETAELVRRSGDKRVELLDLTREELGSTYRKCSVSVVLYSVAGNHLNIRSNRFFESLAAAAPVITSNFPEWRAAVESIGCGLTVDPTDPEAIADALKYLLTHHREAAEMGKRGRLAFLQEFGWTREKDKLLQLYDELRPAARRTSELAATL
jgi:glycosyltransferase involved in cell wall biosynthesis